MAMKDTVFARLRRLLRAEFKIDISKVTLESKLGGSPMGFTTLVVNTELRPAINKFFADLISPFGPGKWDEDSTIGDVVGDILKASSVTTIPAYRNHVKQRVQTALAAVGNGGVPVAQRPAVRATLNKELFTLLLRDVTLADLAGSKSDIVDAIMDRMVV
jgi:hypothetical protein